jgi:hypothetical protein
MAVDNSCTRITGEESEHPPLTSCSQNRSLLKNRKSGQLICYKTGQVYLLLTVGQTPLDTQKPSSYTPAVKKQCIINSIRLKKVRVGALKVQR